MSTEPSIFTRIINREIPSHIVYEDDYTIAFLTIEPVTKGHTLVVPKIPFVNVLDGDERDMGHMMRVAKKVANALVQSGLAEGVNLVMNCGSSAGQEVFHAHLHVIPRTAGDDALKAPTHVEYATDEAAEVSARIINTLQ